MRIVRESINFERGSNDPLRGLNIGHYDKIRRELEKNTGIKTDDVIKYLIDLSHYIYEVKGKNGPFLRFSKILNKTLNMYEKDPYHTDKISFLRDMISDIAHNEWKISQKNFLNWVIKYTKEIDFQPQTLVNTIYGVLYDLHMN